MTSDFIHKPDGAVSRLLSGNDGLEVYGAPNAQMHATPAAKAVNAGAGPWL